MGGASMFDQDSAAARRFYGAVRRFSATAKNNTVGVQFLQVMPPECWDITKLSQRVYGNRHEGLACMAALGIDQANLLTEQRTGAFPTAAKLEQIKRECGYESNPDLRANGKPIWKFD